MALVAQENVSVLKEYLVDQLMESVCVRLGGLDQSVKMVRIS